IIEHTIKKYKFQFTKYKKSETSFFLLKKYFLKVYATIDEKKIIFYLSILKKINVSICKNNKQKFRKAVVRKKFSKMIGRGIFPNETKINRFGSDRKEYIWRRPNEIIYDCTTKPTLKGSGGSMMIWGCIEAKGVGDAAKITGTVNSELYKEIRADEIWNSSQYSLEEKYQEDFSKTMHIVTSQIQLWNFWRIIK
ncbi:hypothetical protein RFI_01112, partial [Reticulomyxa filosa]